MKDKTKFIKSEQRKTGQIGISGYWNYLKSMQGFYFFWPIILILLFIANFSEILFRFFVSIWIDDCSHNLCQGDSFIAHFRQYFFNATQNQLILFFFLFSIYSVLILTFDWFVCVVFLTNGARKLHNKMLHSFLNVRISFFDENPSGRLIRRFSSDYKQLLDEIPNVFLDILNSIAAILVVLIVIFFQAPFIVLAIIPIGFLYYSTQNIFKNASREMQRYTKILETPMWSLFSESIIGYQIIRSFGKTQQFTNRIISLGMNYGKGILLQSRFVRWMQMRIKIGAEFFTLLVTVTVIYFVANNKIGIGQAGFLISLTLGLDATMQWLARGFSLMDTKMVSVERVVEYSTLSPESNFIIPTAEENSHLQNWPTQGCIEFKNYSGSYRSDLTHTLKNINIKLPGKKMIGISGRTGAGKSTIFQALFRMLDVHEGQILIDEVDILKISLQRSRSIFSIVPQDPHLFSGTLKSNLDRTGKFTDEQIWSALKEVELYAVISKLPNGLNYILTERGANFSVGQRQLLCLARAILVNSKIILMDEATASVDPKTDEMILKTIERSFKNKTLLIIAHRLETLKNADFIWKIQ